MNRRSPVLEWLRLHAREVPTSTGHVWRLALAIGRARARRLDESDSSALIEAQSTLRQVAPELSEELRQALDWQGAVEALRAGLDESESDEFENALLTAEDLLAVAQALGDDKASDSFLEDADFFHDRIPERWSHLERFADRRLASASSSAEPPNRIWVMTRLAAQRLWRVPLELLADATQHMSEYVESIQLPSEVYLGASDWFIEASGDTPERHIRAFIVAQDGQVTEVTDLVTEGATQLWELDVPGDAATVFVFESDEPVSGATLPEILEEVRSREDVTVSRKPFSRPS